ncbi:MAG TPA: hypothetical protein VN673_13885 [Clostridia bacterium]|nr:hypothetical protein [Clostridia bacterium]
MKTRKQNTQQKHSELQSHPEHLSPKTASENSNTPQVALAAPAPSAQQPRPPAAHTPAHHIPHTSPATPWRGVFFSGPESDQDREGDEIPVWHVYVGDEHAEPLSKVYNTHSFTRATSLANAMAHDRKLELINEAMPA